MKKNQIVLFAVKKGEPDYMEQLITENSDRIDDAAKWARENGFDRLRITNISLTEKPDFTKTLAI